MTESIAVVRLGRNLRYKLTYVKIFESYLEAGPSPEIVGLLQELIQAQHAAIASLASYLRRLDVKTQDLELAEKLMDEFDERKDAKSRLRFIYAGLERAAAWYQMQLADRQMTAEPEVRDLLFELGEIEAAKMWRTAAVMGMLKIPFKTKEKEYEPPPPEEPIREEVWRPRLAEDVGRPTWTRQGPRPSGPPKARRREKR